MEQLCREDQEFSFGHVIYKSLLDIQMRFQSSSRKYKSRESSGPETNVGVSHTQIILKALEATQKTFVIALGTFFLIHPPFTNHLLQSAQYN